MRFFLRQLLCCRIWPVEAVSHGLNEAEALDMFPEVRRDRSSIDNVVGCSEGDNRPNMTPIARKEDGGTVEGGVLLTLVSESEIKCLWSKFVTHRNFVPNNKIHLGENLRTLAFRLNVTRRTFDEVVAKRNIESGVGSEAARQKESGDAC